MSYGIDLVEILCRAARDIDQILRGANPADIPFYQPTKFQLIANVKAARAIGLTLPQSLLLHADVVIE